MDTSKFKDNYDVVVIGAGMGGLTAASVLAKAGLSVFVGEMNSTPGGCIAGFSRDGYSFETAIHWLNLFGPEGGARKLLSHINPDVPHTPAPKRVRRYKGESFDYNLSSNPDELRDTLIRDYPKDEAGIIRFFNAARKLGSAFERMTGNLQDPATMTMGERVRLFGKTTAAGIPFMKYSRIPAEKGLAQFFPNTKAGQIFCSEARLVSCLVPIGWIYNNDYHLAPKGGAKRLAEWMADSFTALGGHIAYRALATRIVVENHQATNVVFKDKQTGDDFQVGCRHVVAAGDLEKLYAELLPKTKAGHRFASRIRAADMYDSAVTISLGLRRPVQEYGMGEELVYLSKDDVPRHVHDSGDPDTARITLFSPSAVDPGTAPEGKGNLSIYLPAKFSLFDNWHAGETLKRGEAYRDFKKRYADTILKRIEKSFIPGLREDIVLCDVATPLTYRRYTGNLEGSIMGTRMSFMNMMRRVSGYTTPLSNVYIGSQWAEYSGGVPLAIRAGANSAMRILRLESRTAYEAGKDMFVSP